MVMSDPKYKTMNSSAAGSRAQLVVSKPQPYKMIQENIWQELIPGHSGTQGCRNKGVRAAGGVGGGAAGSTENRSPHPHTPQTPRYTLYFWINLSLSHTHNPANIISSSDRWARSDLVENEATNLHPRYTVIGAQLQTCMWMLALAARLLPR